LFLWCGEVALLNQFVVQAEAFVVAALYLIPTPAVVDDNDDAPVQGLMAKASKTSAE
jgi:hypothetical protein